MPSSHARQDRTTDRCLLLVRHAKSAWDDPMLDDHDRPLAPRGLAALPKMRDHLAASPCRPDLVLCSSARRTRDTLAGIEPAIPDRARIEIDASLYGAGAVEYLTRLRGLDDAVGCAMLVGHNPGLQDLVVLLAGSGDEPDRAQVASKLPTGAIVTLSFLSTWAGVGSAGARLDRLFMPRRPRR